MSIHISGYGRRRLGISRRREAHLPHGPHQRLDYMPAVNLSPTSFRAMWGEVANAEAISLR